MGVIGSLSMDQFFSRSIGVTGDARLGNGVRLRGVSSVGLLTGRTGGNQETPRDGAGSVWRTTAGIELRSSGKRTRLFGGFDGGYQARTWTGSRAREERHSGPLIDLRWGLERGAGVIRGRIAHEMTWWDATDNGRTVSDEEMTNSLQLEIVLVF